jgi:mannose-6-phosphate isomerase-like protein (cupin superfamily)
MSDAYTIGNLRESEDMAPRFGLADVQEARFPSRDLGAADTGFAYYVIKPHQGGFAHRHEQAEEVYLVLRGSGRVKLGDEVHAIGPYDAIRVAPELERAFAADDEPMELLAFGPRHEGDGEILEGDPWS